MVIQLEMLYDSPLSIAEALIQREMMRCKDEYSAQVARENTWQMGMALLNHAESCKRIEQWAEPQTDYNKSLELFAEVLFDKEKSEQFLKECKAMGIEPQTDCSWK